MGTHSDQAPNPREQPALGVQSGEDLVEDADGRRGPCIDLILNAGEVPWWPRIPMPQHGHLVGLAHLALLPIDLGLGAHLFVWTSTSPGFGGFGPSAFCGALRSRGLLAAAKVGGDVGLPASPVAYMRQFEEDHASHQV